jgi:transcriptional regulator with XRE-family HTH domain
MNNFSSIFVKLREQRGLSIKQIASFTGASTKDVKKWEAGTSLPTDQKIVAALEGLLGKDISNTLENNEFKVPNRSEKIIEESLFQVDKEKNIDLKSGIFNRFKSDIEKKQKRRTSEMNVFDIYSDKSIEQENKVLNYEDLYENALEEQPYIRDPKTAIILFFKKYENIYFNFCSFIHSDESFSNVS